MKYDPIHHPAHYTQGGMEVIDILRAKLTVDEFRGYCVGNALKYIFRHRLKGGDQDLEKAIVYIGWARQGESKP